MDTLLVGGDHCTDARGLPIKIDGDRETVQRALIRLSVRRGALPAEPGLGSELYKLRGARGELLDRLALSYVQEALAPMAGVSVEKVGVERSGEGMTVAVVIGCRQGSYRLEVEVA